MLRRTVLARSTGVPRVLRVRLWLRVKYTSTQQWLMRHADVSTTMSAKRPFKHEAKPKW
jgi:hypothetical protein